MEEEQAPATGNKFDEILSLFDLYWFNHLIIFSPPPPPPPAVLPAPHTHPPSLPPHPIGHRRTRSDESNSTFLPPAVKQPPRLQTILSGKESINPIQSSQVNSSTEKRRRKQRNRLSRSMSELELEELKGLLDLGFNFSDTEVEADPRIADIVPGLRKRRSEGEVEVVTRPYLSEAWGVRDEEERRKVLRDWSVLANGDERDVKEQLRRWAHAVASTVQ